MKKGVLFLLLFGGLIFSCSEDDPNELANQIPTCTITSPDNQDEIELGETISITADASVTLGRITEVGFYIDDSRVDFSNNLPYNYSWDTSNDTLGSHTLKIIAKNNSEESAIDEIVVFLTDGRLTERKPEANFIATQVAVILGTSIEFIDQSTNFPFSWSWDFGDGNISNSQNPSHTYASTGNYNVSLVATNNFGSDTIIKTKYLDVTLIEKETGTITDYDGNVYKTIKIGNQWWMSENLKVTHYPNGAKIQIVEDYASWHSLGTEGQAMCYYNNSLTHANTYGALYTWAAAKKNACPSGWHLPRDDEWKELEIYLGMMKEDADKFGYRGTNEGSKLAGNSELWEDGRLDSNAEFGKSGFNALPAGVRGYGSYFDDIGESTHFWSSSEGDESTVWVRSFYEYESVVSRANTYAKNYGYSVRCVKNY